MEGIVKGIINLGNIIHIDMEMFSEVGYLFIQKARSRDTKDYSYKGLEDNIFFRWVVVGLGLKVSINVSPFMINLVGQGDIKLMIDNNTKERKGVGNLNFYG